MVVNSDGGQQGSIMVDDDISDDEKQQLLLVTDVQVVNHDAHKLNNRLIMVDNNEPSWYTDNCNT